MTQFSNKYDLEERTENFGREIIFLCKTISSNHINKTIINQLIRSATSIGANYMEANGASSKKDFTNKIHICKKEAQETKHWLKMLSFSLDEPSDRIKDLWKECQELTLIFQKITSSLKN